MQTEPVKAPPNSKLRPGALLVSGVINIGGALVVLFAMPGHATADRMAAAWALVQFLSGVWAGVLGANSPFLHGMVCGLPALVLGFAFSRTLPGHYLLISWMLVPAAALIAAALMRFMRRRGP